MDSHYSAADKAAAEASLRHVRNLLNAGLPP
jgi:hypothetical protein